MLQPDNIIIGPGGSRIVATLRADGQVYPTNFAIHPTPPDYVSRINVLGKQHQQAANTLVVPTAIAVSTTVVDLGKQLLQVTRENDEEGVRDMLTRGAPFATDWLGMSALHFAVIHNQYEICDLLLKAGINKDSKTKVDRTPLHYACYYGHDMIVELLLSRHCNVNPRDMLRMTPLHWAVEKQHRTTTRLLLKYDAEVDVFSKFHKSPISLAVYHELPDLLEELQAKREEQAKQRIKEIEEKETHAAINSIIAPEDDDNVLTVEVNNEITISDTSAPTIDFTKVEETGELDDSTVDLLRSHGISMMQDDEDTSKDLLTSALQNGRQLVLTEGGRLLLSESLKTEPSTNINNNNIAPMRVRNDLLGTPAINKVRQTVAMKTKESPLLRNKNIRVITLNDFRKLYKSNNIRAIHTVQNGEIIPMHTSELHCQSVANNVYQHRLANNVNQHRLSNNVNQHRLANNVTNNTHSNASNSVHNNTISSDPPKKTYVSLRQLENGQLKVEPFTSEETSFSPMNAPRSTSAPDYIDEERETDNQSPPFRVLPPTLAPLSATGGIQVRRFPIVHCKPPTTPATSPAQLPAPVSMPIKRATSVAPVLSQIEICRQLNFLRRQNDELRRKVDAVTLEKDHILQRLAALEQIIANSSLCQSASDYVMMP